MAKETTMFSLKFDLLFPTIASAKELARSLRLRRGSKPTEHRDPREIQRIRTELRSALEAQRAKGLEPRYHVF